MDKPLVVITDVTDLDVQPAIEILTAAGCEVMVLDLADGAPVPAEARGAVAALAGYAFLGREFFDALPRLGFIATASVGTDMVDAAEAAARGVRVQGLGGVATEEVAAHALALILAVERDIPAAAAGVAAGAWSEAYTALPRRLSTLTLGLWGLGRIGSRLAEIAAPLFGSVIASDPYVSTAPPGVDALVGVDELLGRSDVLSLHVPLTDETRGMLDAERLAALPRAASVVNVSRGELIDPYALAAALDAGALRGAGLDVLIGEPPTAEDPLRAHPRTIVTPHVAYLSAGALEGYERIPALTVSEWLLSRRN